MHVNVKLYASFRIRWGKEIMRECHPGARIADIVTAIGIPANERYIIVLNGIHASLDAPLHDGDVLSLFPLIGGG